MKFSLIVAVVVLALAQGSFAQDATDLERLSQYFEDMKNRMTEMMKNQDLTSQAQTFLANKKAELEPLAAQVQEHLKTFATSIGEQAKPLTDNVQAQVQPMVEELQKQVESMFQKVTEQARAIAN